MYYAVFSSGKKNDCNIPRNHAVQLLQNTKKCCNIVTYISYYRKFEYKSLLFCPFDDFTELAIKNQNNNLDQYKAISCSQKTFYCIILCFMIKSLFEHLLCYKKCKYQHSWQSHKSFSCPSKVNHTLLFFCYLAHSRKEETEKTLIWLYGQKYVKLHQTSNSENVIFEA